MTGFFPETSRRDVWKALWVILVLVLLAFVPTLAGYSGFLLGTNAGILIFVFFLIYGLWLYRDFPFVTKGRISQVITMPFRSLSALYGGFIAAFIAAHIPGFNGIAARVFAGFFAGTIEGLCIYLLAMYISITLVYLLKQRNHDGETS